jgi:hypothetical protein
MSSATVLFVLKHILDLPPREGDERICSMAFGPGLTVETGLFTKVRQRANDPDAVAGDTFSGDTLSGDTEPSLA